MRPVIRPIQYLRGIAAMMVVWHHAISQIDGTKGFIPAPEFGKYGVDLFFVISGFIMLVTTWDKPITPSEFVRHRIRRIVPLYWMATLLMITIDILSPAMFKTFKFDAPSLLKSLFFIPYYSLSSPGDIYPLLVPGWTLNIEMFFYAMFAITLLVERNWRTPLMVVALAALVVAGQVLQPVSAGWRIYTNYRLLEFGAGMILGRLWMMRAVAKRRPVDTRPNLLSYLGDASYSIYLTHLFTLGMLRAIWVNMVHTPSLMSSIALMAVSLAVSAGVGYLCYQLVERPLTTWISNRRLVIRIEAIGDNSG
jgi:exopolysaccharide production protein ExoZ